MTDNTKTITVEHPLEGVLDIESGTTELLLSDHQTEVSTEHILYDDKDQDIEKLISEVYSAAMSAYDQQSVNIQLIDPKYRARSSEVAVQFLQTALNAIKEKSNFKQHKDKIEKNAGPKTLNQTIIMDRNDLLRQIIESAQNSPPDPTDK